MPAVAQPPSMPAIPFVGLPVIGQGGNARKGRRERDSLISAGISLIARFNSLLGGKKFPVRMRRELACETLILPLFLLPLTRRRAPDRIKFPVFSLLRRSSLETATPRKKNWSGISVAMA